MSQKKFRKNDTGSALELVFVEDESAVDISQATVKRITLMNPGGAVAQKEAAFSSDGTDGKIRYVIQAGDLDTAGWWKAEGYVELAGKALRTSKARFEVEPTLS